MIERRINRCEIVMENMTPLETSWKLGLKTAKLHKKMIPSEVLLAAASICYHGPLTNLARAELMNDWLDRCRVKGFNLPPLQHQQVLPSGDIICNLGSKVVSGTWVNHRQLLYCICRKIKVRVPALSFNVMFL